MNPPRAHRLAVGDPILDAMELRAEKARRAGRFDEAEAWVRRVMALDDRRRSARRILGEVHLERGAYVLAFEQFKALSDAAPHDVWSASRAGEALYYAGHFRAAKHWLEHAVKVSADDSPRCRRRSRILLQKIARHRRAQ